MPHLAVERIAKSYDGNPAVRDISFAVEPGRVLALCGENGAGKSTLMRMLSGATLPDSGAILLDGEPVRDRRAGGRDGARHLHGLPGAEPAAAPQRGRERAPRPDADAAACRSSSTGRRPTGSRGGCSPTSAFPDIDPTAPVGSLSVARQQIVEIAKALVSAPRILILDEPTAVLSASETGAAVRQGQEPRRRRRDGALHLAPAGGDLRDRRRDRGAQGRRERAGRPGWRARHRGDHPRHGRPAAVDDLSRSAAAAPAGWCWRSSASASAAVSRT